MTSCACGDDLTSPCPSIVATIVTTIRRFPGLSWLLVLCLVPTHSRSTTGDRTHETVGWRSTQFPIVNYSSDDGAGYGLRLNVYEYDGVSIPYRRKYSAQLFITTGGKWVHRLLADLPELRPGHRVEAELVYEKEDFANYYGGLADEVVETRTRDQKTFRRAYPEARVMWIRDLRGPWRARVGMRGNHTSIDPNAPVGSLLTELDPPGADGGLFVQLESALRYDTRDNYNNTFSGRFEELLLQYGLGRNAGPGGVTVSLDHRQFQGLAPGLVLGCRLRGDLVLGELPFYEELELGGSSSIRGLSASRDRGEARLLLNTELRWRGLPLWRRRQVWLGGLIFADLGQIFELEDGLSSSRWRRGLGSGLRLYWHSTIVRADYGSSGRGTGLYITFAQVF